MSDNVTHIPGARRRKLRHRLLIMAGVVLLVAALAALYFFSDGPAGQPQEDAAISVSGAVMESFSFDAHSSNEYAAFNGGLAVASVSGLSVYAADGAESCVLQTTMATPRVLSCGEAVMAYDVGGYNLMAVGKKGTELLNVTAAKPILDADLSPDGYVCYSTSESGYKSILYVYNPRGAMIYRWLSSSQYLPICTVSPEGTYMAAVALGQANGIFESSLVVFRTDSEEIYSTVTLGNELFYDLEFLEDGTLCAVGESSSMWLRMDGTVLGKYSYGGAYLKDFDFGGSGFLTLSLNMYKAGNSCTVVTVSPSGEELGSSSYTEEILDSSAAGNYVAVLTANGLDLYKQDMTRTARLDATQSATAVVMRMDGTALLLSGGTGRKFIP